MSRPASASRRRGSTGVGDLLRPFLDAAEGKYIITSATGTACHVKKSHSILHALYEKLKLSDEKRTTDDLLFTVETVSCLGACGLAPVMLVNVPCTAR